jgi:hypothetical protein
MGSELFRFTLSPAFGRKTCVGGWGGNGGYYGTLADSGFRIVKLVTGDKLLTFYCKVTKTQFVTLKETLKYWGCLGHSLAETEGKDLI